jgi:hypothetical protein
MSNRLKLCAYVLAGILLSVAVSGVLYFIAYPLVTKTLINQNTVHKGDLVLEKDQELTIDNATYINDGSIIVQDNAKLILKNAVLKLNLSSFPNYPLYYVELTNNAKLEASNSTITSTTSQHYGIYLYDRASIALNQVNLTELTVFGGKTMTVQNSSLEALTIQGDGSLAIARSTLQSLHLYGNANISISNCHSPSAVLVYVQGYYGTLSLNQTHFNATVSAYDSAFFIRGNATFGPNSTLTLTAQDNITSSTYLLENFTLPPKAIFINTISAPTIPSGFRLPNQTESGSPQSTLPWYIGQLPPVYDNQTGLLIMSGPPPVTFEFTLTNRTLTISKGENITIPVTVIDYDEGNVSLSMAAANSTLLPQPLSIPGINATISASVLPVSPQSPTTFNVTISIGREAQSGNYWLAIFGKENWGGGWVGEYMPVEIIIP